MTRRLNSMTAFKTAIKISSCLFAASERETRARRLLSLILVFATVFAVGPTAPLFAQAAAGAPMMLHITILEGEDSLNNIRERTAREPIVQVEDENHKPVAGALILFSIQNSGPGAGASFNGASTLSVTTGADGRAVAHGLTPNATAGSYTIAVTATLGALTATAVIHQSNVAGGSGGGAAAPTAATAGKAARTGLHFSKRVWITGATVVATAVVVGVVIATRGPSATTITPGTGTVGP
jgi:hypothetical protein